MEKRKPNPIRKKGEEELVRLRKDEAESKGSNPLQGWWWRLGLAAGGSPATKKKSKQIRGGSRLWPHRLSAPRFRGRSPTRPASAARLRWYGLPSPEPRVFLFPSSSSRDFLTDHLDPWVVSRAETPFRSAGSSRRAVGFPCPGKKKSQFLLVP